MGSFAFLWVLLSLLPLTWHTHPPQADPGLNTLGKLGSLYSLCICGSRENLQPRTWKLNSVPWGGVPGGRCLLYWAAHDPVNPAKAWQELVSWDWNFSLKACFSGASGSVPLIFQESNEQLVSIYGASTECPVVKAFPPVCHLPVLSGEHIVLYCTFFLITGTGIKKFWEVRKMHGSLL